MGATIAEMSFIFVLSSVGSLVGCMLTGAMLDRLPRYTYLLLAVTLVGLGLANSALPYCPSLPSLYTVALLGGLASGSLDTGGNVLLLNIWSGRDSGPYMHALHFTFGIGAFLAPVVAGHSSSTRRRPTARGATSHHPSLPASLPQRSWMRLAGPSGR